MSKFDKVLLIAFVIYLISQRNQTLGTTLGNASQSFWEAQTAFTIF